MDAEIDSIKVLEEEEEEEELTTDATSFNAISSENERPESNESLPEESSVSVHEEYSHDISEENDCESNTTEENNCGSSQWNSSLRRTRNTSQLDEIELFERRIESSWREIDKQRLLVAMERYGILNMEELMNAVPGKSEEEIRKYIALKWKSARIDLKTHLKEMRKTKNGKSLFSGPIDSWLETLNKFYPRLDHYKTNPLAHAILLIWKYEKHPDPSECGGIDFKALYEYLYYVLCGYPPKHLNQPTAKYLQETLKNFAQRIKYGDCSQEMSFLASPLKINMQNNPPVTEDEVLASLSYSQDQCFKELMKFPGFNPFCVPEELLLKKVSSCMENTSSTSDTTPTSSGSVFNSSK